MPGMTHHMKVNLAGALAHFRESDWRDCCTDYPSGKILTPLEVKQHFQAELAKGHRYHPVGNCPTFDFMNGCPGHPDPCEVDPGQVSPC